MSTGRILRTDCPRGRWMPSFVRNSGRGERIRTSGLYVPNVALYQAKLHPEVFQRSLQSL